MTLHYAIISGLSVSLGMAAGALWMQRQHEADVQWAATSVRRCAYIEAGRELSFWSQGVCPKWVWAPAEGWRP